jgi:hypothetical protein
MVLLFIATTVSQIFLVSFLYPTLIYRIYEINGIENVTPTLVGFDKIILPVKPGVTKVF